MTSEEKDKQAEPSVMSNALGQGNYSKIHRSYFENELCAVKAIKKYDCGDGDPERRKEQESDIATELAFLMSGAVADCLDWNWRPKFLGLVQPSDITVSQLKRYTDSLGFEPASLIYMEELYKTMQVFFEESCTTEEGTKCLFRLLSDLLATIVALYRMDVRHNDLMFRNIMLRKKLISRSYQRTIILKNGRTLQWDVDPDYEIVLIDFGLSSYGGGDLLPSAVVDHKTRAAQFGIKNISKITSKTHPLEFPPQHPARHIVDIHCIWHCIKSARHKMRKKMTRQLLEWCESFVDTVEKHITTTHHVDCEELVATIFPPH